MIYKTVKGKKIGDSIIQLENGDLQFIYPDTFYKQEVMGFWLLKTLGRVYTIERFLKETQPRRV